LRPNRIGRDLPQQVQAQEQAEANQRPHLARAASIRLEQHEPQRDDRGQDRVRVDDVCLLRDVTQSTGDLAAKPQPHETLNELVNAEQQR
jgi:hypothetical protein